MTEREGKLSCAECYGALLKFHNDKALGNDGMARNLGHSIQRVSLIAETWRLDFQRNV